MDVGVAWEVKQDIEQALVAHCAAYPQVGEGEGETGCVGHGSERSCGPRLKRAMRSSMLVLLRFT